MSAEPLLIGHRGAPRLAQENTVAAFRQALAAGLDGLETDVQRTAEGALVLHHDPWLPGGVDIASVELAQLQDLAPEVPRLADLLPVLLDYPTARLNLEVKTAAPRDDDRAADLAVALAEWPVDVRERTWLSTFDPLLLLSLEQELAAAAVSVPLAFLLAAPVAERLLGALPVVAVHPHHALVTHEKVRDWHDRGLHVYTWTVNDPALAARLLDAGVDGLIGDVPDLLLAARSARARR